MSTTSSRAEPPQTTAQPRPLGYSRFPFSDAFLSLFFARPLADREIFLFSGACSLSPLALTSSPSIKSSLTYVAPLSFIPASSFRHSVTFMYGVFASFTLSISFSTPQIDPCGHCAYFLLPANASAIIFIRSAALSSPSSSFSSSTLSSREPISLY